MASTGITSGFTIVMAFADVDTIAVGEVSFADGTFPGVLDLASNVFTCFRWHCDETASFAAGMTCTGIAGGFAGIVAFADVHAVAMN